MSRVCAMSVLAFVACISASAWPVAARADVLEIGATGPVWVAGGPANGLTASASPSAVVESVSAVPHAASVTEVAATAGPAAWRDHLAALSVKYDISPSLLEALIWQESRWRVGAVSPAGARGLAQLMPGTARQLGVDPDSPNANLEGGARYLRQQLDAFGGDIEKALAAYNAGPARVEKAGGIPAIRETRNYVAAILARLSTPVRR